MYYCSTRLLHYLFVRSIVQLQIKRSFDQIGVIYPDHWIIFIAGLQDYCIVRSPDHQITESTDYYINRSSQHILIFPDQII
jgi:hypothetical protein